MEIKLHYIREWELKLTTTRVLDISVLLNYGYIWSAWKDHVFFEYPLIDTSRLIFNPIPVDETDELGKPAPIYEARLIGERMPPFPLVFPDNKSKPDLNLSFSDGFPHLQKSMRIRVSLNVELEVVNV